MVFLFILSGSFGYTKLYQSENEVIMSIDKFLIKLDQTTVHPYKADLNMDQGIFLALKSAAIGSYRWDLKNDAIYLSEIIYEVCGMPRDFRGSLFELLQLVFDKQSMFKFVRIMMQMYEKSKGDFIDVDIFLII